MSTTHRRHNSTAKKFISLPSRNAVPSAAQAQLIEPKSTHVADPALQLFLNHSFDPAEYLNSVLPSLQTSVVSRGDSVPLVELSTQTQTLLSQLSAHATRLTTTLTQLTDEILRSGSRLAYEVEVLRGETLGLSEALTEGLQGDVVKFVPGGLDQQLASKNANGARRGSMAAPKTPTTQDTPTVVNPPYIVQLRTLTLIRSRLETVIKTFGDAMSWTFPPSEVSVTSAFLSVSAPEPGSQMNSVEEKGQEVSSQLRQEIADLLMGGDPIDGIEAAAKRVEALKELAVVWKGTAEERARIKFVESLAQLVEDRHRDLLREAEHNDRLRQRVETLDEKEEGKSEGGFGFLSHLQRLRG
ncbi:hypothetical protein BJ878DRAFT_512621 [Calycina marina]|uniref:Uncharacterized protein n=1 Tax=Calycina marina TaxID=1763456 RepID=A0A9P7Z165_9HELO|nr:hypothetical protein BJ878DRAFT_512621 [Calycina marina]